MRKRQRVEEGAEQGPAVAEVQRDEQALDERLAGVEDGGQDARLRVGRERACGLRAQVARLDEHAQGGAGELRRRLGEERGGGGQSLLGREVLPEAGRGRVERHGAHLTTTRARPPSGAEAANIRADERRSPHRRASASPTRSSPSCRRRPPAGPRGAWPVTWPRAIAARRGPSSAPSAPPGRPRPAPELPSLGRALLLAALVLAAMAAFFWTLAKLTGRIE